MARAPFAGEIELVFIGTRGNTEPRSRRHRRHSALLVCCADERVMIDCGADWLHAVERLAPSAIVLTHAHPDHAKGLAGGAPCPVFATAETWASLEPHWVADRRVVVANAPFRIGGLRLQAFPVEHSIRAPAVGYRISRGRSAFFYVPDVVAIRERSRALRGVQLYVGDGATIARPMVRRRLSALVGHTPIRTQLGWCAKEGVADAIFTHCGAEIVLGNARELAAVVKRLGAERGVAARIAYDGMRVALPVLAIRRARRAAAPEHA